MDDGNFSRSLTRILGPNSFPSLRDRCAIGWGIPAGLRDPGRPRHQSQCDRAAAPTEKRSVDWRLHGLLFGGKCHWGDRSHGNLFTVRLVRCLRLGGRIQWNCACAMDSKPSADDHGTACSRCWMLPRMTGLGRHKLTLNCVWLDPEATIN